MIVLNAHAMNEAPTINTCRTRASGLVSLLSRIKAKLKNRVLFSVIKQSSQTIWPIE